MYWRRMALTSSKTVRQGYSAWIGAYKLGRPLLESRRVSFIGLASHPPSRDRMGRGCDRVRSHCTPPFAMLWGGGLTTS